MSIPGTFTMSPTGPFEAGSATTITFRIIVGEAGMAPGGWVKIGTPDMGWGQPLVVSQWEDDEFLVGRDLEHNPWKPINTSWKLTTESDAILRLSVDESVLLPSHNDEVMDAIAGKQPLWKWYITATVERGGLNPGDVIEITYGDTEQHGEGVCVAPWSDNDDHEFFAILSPKADNRFGELDGSPVAVRYLPGPAEKIIAVLPSIAKAGTEIPLRLSVLDRNLCPPSAPYDGEVSVEPEGVVQFGAEGEPEPDSLPVRAMEEGLGRIHVGGPESVRSNPVLVEADPKYNLYWGDLHAQSMYHSWQPEAHHGLSCNTPREVHAYARDCTFLDFVALTDGFAANPRCPGWEEIQQAAIDLYEPGRYVTLKGWECGMDEQGDKCVIYRSAEMEGYIPKMNDDGKHPSAAHALIDFYKNHAERVLTIPHSFMKYLDWTVMDPELDRLMEVYSCWGSYETRRNNPLNSKRQPANKSGQHAWRSGLLLGVTAAGDSHIGYPGRSMMFSDPHWCQNWKAGICAVYAPELTREGVWDGLYDRRCYGTTGVRIVLDFKLNDAIMGSVLEYAPGSSELGQRNIKVRVAGTAYVDRIEILRNNAVIHTERPYDDSSVFDLEDILEEAPTTRDWYTVRVFQADGNAAWSSPIWVGPEGVDEVTWTDLE
jgi:Protein of unknown function (DUF3604)